MRNREAGIDGVNGGGEPESERIGEPKQWLILSKFESNVIFEAEPRVKLSRLTLR